MILHISCLTTYDTRCSHKTLLTWVRTASPRPLSSTTIAVKTVWKATAMKVFTPKIRPVLSSFKCFATSALSIKLKRKINIFFFIINKDHILYITDNTSIKVIKIGGRRKNVPNKYREAWNTFYVKYTFCLTL